MVCLNQATIQPQDGNFIPPHNCLHEGNPGYLIETVQADRFGEPLYPTIIDKAAHYCHSSICNHLFSDGNKRTGGLGAALVFLNLHGYDLAYTMT